VPKFFFHIRTAFNFQPDEEGLEFGSSALARSGAIAAIRDALSQAMSRGQTVDGRWFEIADEAGTIVEVVSFNEAIRLP
jgi:hypothetical protein